MKNRLALALLSCSLVPAAGWGQAKDSATPTFSRDVAPVFYKNCVICHRAGEIAPMSLLTYQEARPWARAIREKVSLGQMPPWHADAPRGTFANDRRLTDREKDTLIRWATNGAPQGDPKTLTPLPKFAEGWEIGAPDAVIPMDKSYEVPASGTVPYQYFTVPTNFSEDKWIQALEVRPGSRKVVHHILVFARAPGTATPQETGFLPVVPEIPRNPGRGSGGRGALIATTAPGTNAMIFEPGTALLIKAGSVLTFQVHYTACGTATQDRSSVGIVFAKEPPKQRIRTSAFMNPLLQIPPGAADQA
ncbi:MAG TPA: thiol-disulfide isomerase, partial [Candidatus Sulfopaludibacter sp.]|nr:thiol-disulfide isomerase [Candidatus Sulfopaludibacter sp.]